ncbi:MAG: metallophosphoesterase [Myxococcales bacterium]|nr:metallophosphoesterase [Myxococcales bacterium]
MLLGSRAPLAFAVATLALGAACASRHTQDPPRLDPHEERPVVAVAVRDPEPAAARPAALAAGTCEEGGAGKKARFTLAHFNDFQARYTDRIGGRSRYAYVAGYLRALKREVPSTLVLDAGDDYEKGSLAELRSMGETTRRMIQALPIDVRTIGNHDFSYGEAAVVRDVELSAHPVLAANVTYERDGKPLFERFVKARVGCVTVGIVGLVTQNYGADDQPTREPFCGVFKQDNHYAEVLEREVKAHRGEVDVMIALTHLGMYDDASLASAVSGVDLVVGAHTEDLLKEPRLVMRPDGTRAWVLQAGHYAETLGRADLVWDPKDRSLAFEKYRIVDVDTSLPHAEDVARLADDVEKDAVPELHAVVAVSRTEIKPGREMADLVWRAAQDRWAADALVVGRDHFWEGIPRGPVTLARLYRTVLVQREPTGTTGFSSLYVAEVTGEELLALKASMTGASAYEMYLPHPVAPKKTYRLLLDKRAMMYPGYAFTGAVKAPAGRFAGELIDVLESYARARGERGLPLD